MKFAVRIASAVLFLALHGSLQAQVTPPTRAGASAPGKISGLVQTAEGQPLPAVAITIRSAQDSAIVTGALTGKDGRFVIDGLPLGGYLIRVSLIGYKPRSSEPVTLSTQTGSYDFGTIKLDVVPIELKAVEAVAERSAVIVEADRTVYNTKSMAAAAGTAVDVLRAVPELEVDINDNVKLRGNQSAVIQLNGRPAPLRGEQLTNFLKQLPGNRIDRVEVMPNPSAKNDPEGMGGIINIVLKDNVDLGLSGSISGNGSTRNQQYLNGRINYQRGRFTIFTGAGANLYGQESFNWDLRQNLATQPTTSIEQNSIMDNGNTGGNVDWTAEFKLAKQTTLWSNSWMWFGENSNSGLLKYNITQDGDVVRDRYDRDSDHDGSNASYDIGLGLVQVFLQQKHELRIDSRISRNGYDSRSRLTKLFLMSGGAPVDLPIELTLNDIDQKNGNLFVTTDYFRPLGKGRLDLGYQAWKRDQDSDTWLRIFEWEGAADPRQDTRVNYVYDETFHSLYALYGQTLGKFAFQAGARGQFSNTDFTSLVSGLEIDRSYHNVFPSFNVSFTPKPGRTARVTFSRSISRPSATLINPDIPTTDPLNISRGNPDLKPSFTNSVRLDLSMTGKHGTVRVSPYYRSTVDVWERIRTVDAQGVATNRWENSASAEAYGSSFSISLAPTGKLSGSGNVSVYRDVRDGRNISSTLHRDAIMWSLGGYFGYKFGKTTTAQLNANYFPTQSILQGRASGYTYTGVGLRQQVWGTKGSISLNVNDPLNLYKFNSYTRDATYIQNSKSSYKSRVATLGFTYNFGKPPQQMSRRTGEESGGGETIRVR